MTTAIVEIRSQKSRGSSDGKFGGPDTYVAVQVVPEGVDALTVLNRSVAKRRGIEIIYCGEGYSTRRATERSMLGAAIAEAEHLAAKINAGGVPWSPATVPETQSVVPFSQLRR